MYNYNRDVYQAEHERFERMMTASQRQVPYHLRRSSFKQAAGWLSGNIGDPVGTGASGFFGPASRRLAVYYRRASTRVAGLVLNTLEGLLGMAPGRT